jgi:hypothetical protein
MSHRYGHSLRAAGRGEARPPPRVCVRIRGERPQGRRSHADRAVRVTARTPASDLPEPPLHPTKRITLGPAGGELGQVPGDRRQPEHAWAALLGRLARQIAQDSRSLVQAALARWQHVQNASTG